MSDRSLGQLDRLLQGANPLVFDDLTARAFNEEQIAFVCERIEAMSDPPGDPPVTSEEYQRAGKRQLATLREMPNPPGFGDEESPRGA